VTLRAAVLAAMACAFLGASGCGEESGVADGATVTAYVAAPLCGEAKRELEGRGARAGEVRVRLFCLEATGRAAGLDLATVGENARRASEDSTAVGYLEAPGDAVRFGRPILETAGIAVVVDSSGAAGMKQLLDAVEAADSRSVRESVRSALD
jgi:hypothetical protein